jgi:HSP20 family protein
MMTITEYLLVLSPLFGVGIGTFRVNGFVYSSGPAKLPRQPKTTRQQISMSKNGDFNPNFASSPRNRIRKDCANANEAFRELRDEFGNNNNNRETTMDGQFEWVVGGADPFEAIDKKTGKKWIEKAFDLASEFNNDFTAESEKDATDEMLQISRDWVARMYYEDTEAAIRDCDSTTESSSNHQPDHSVSSGTESEDRESASVPIPDKPNEVVSETPNSETRSDEEIFRVSIDLPGVDRTDVDVTVVEDGGDFLLIRAKRDTGSDGAPVRTYSKKITIPEKQQVDMDKLEASLKNGVLVVSAPKLKPRVSERKIVIS